MRLIGVDQRGRPRWAGSDQPRQRLGFEVAERPPASPEEGEWSIETWRAGKTAYAVCVALATGLLVAHALS